MKKLIPILFVLIGLCSIDAEAQKRRKNKTRLRNVEGMKYLEFSGGVSGIGYYGQAGGGIYFLDKMSIKGNVSMERGRVFDLNIERIVGDLQYGYTFYGIESTLFISLHVGLTGSFDRAKQSELFSVEEKINFGALLSPEVALFILNNLSVFARSEQRLMFKENFGRFRNYTGVGIRLNIR